jgi:hypothetical protein
MGKTQSEPATRRRMRWRMKILSAESSAALVVLCLMLPLGNAKAGGFIIDPTNCPSGNWFPGPPIPQKVTDALCRFLLAVDNQDFHAAYDQVSPDFRSGETLDQFVQAGANARRLGGAETGSRAERFVLDAAPDRSEYRFVTQVYYPKGAFREEIYIRATSSGAEVAGLKIGPM